MNTAEKVLYHQIHPLKLAVDITGGIASTVLVWQHALAFALAVGFIPSILVTAGMISTMDFEAQRDSALGHYIAKNMPPLAQGVRMLGQIGAWVGAWEHSPAGIAAGALVIIGGWTWALFLPSRCA